LLLHFFPHFAFLAATAGVGLGAAGDAGAIIDSAGLDSGEGGDVGGEGDGEVEDEGGDTGGEGADGTASGDGTQQAKPEGDSKIDWRTVPAEVKSHIQEIAKTNPKLGNLLQNAVYTSQTFLREVPGGLKEIRALKTSIEEAGGLDEIKNIQGIHKNLVDQQETMDNQAREGNPEVLDNLIEISGDGFGKLMPVAMSRWESKDPQGYQYELSKIMVTAMKDGGIVSDLNMAFSMLRLNNPEATKEGIAALQRVGAWINGVGNKALKAPEKPAVDPKLAKEQESIDQQKAQLFNQEFSTDFGSWRNKQINDEVAKISNGRQLNDYQMKTLGDRVVSDIRDILTSDPDYMKDLQRLYGSRDKAELLKFTKARTSKLLPEATKKAFRSLFSNPSGKKPGVKKVTPISTAPGATQPVKGWQKVAADKAPAPDAINSKLTTFEMKFRKQAILKDGTKVFWGNTAPKD
jgi:hypothetical protein